MPRWSAVTANISPTAADLVAAATGNSEAGCREDLAAIAGGGAAAATTGTRDQRAAVAGVAATPAGGYPNGVTAGGGCEPPDDTPWAIGRHLPDEDAPEVGRSVGLWLDVADFVIAYEDGNLVGVDGVVDVGTHGFPRDWPKVYKGPGPSTVLKQLLKKTGPCAAKRVARIPSPDAKRQFLVEGVPLQPLQSFENAAAIAAKTGMSVVKGWAVFDLLNMNPGEGYLAERYWWNTTGEGSSGTGDWVDFTPRPLKSPDLFLVESVVEMLVSPRRAQVLTSRHHMLSESLSCIRFQDATAVMRVEVGSEAPAAFPLKSIDTKGGGGIRSAMRAADIAGALGRQLASDKHTFPIVLLLAVLIRCLQADCSTAFNVDMFVTLDGVDALFKMLEAQNLEIAAAAASAMALVCRKCSAAKNYIRDHGTAKVLAAFFARCGKARELRIRRLGDVARAFWEMLGPPAREVSTPSPLGYESWEPLRLRCWEQPHEEHAALPPRERQAQSWARTLAFARVCVAARGVSSRIATSEKPFLIWVLGADDGVEGQLAADGYFKDANFLDLGPTEIAIFGDGLRDLGHGGVPQEGKPPVVRTASYDDLFWLTRLSSSSPDLAVVFMPEVVDSAQPDQPQTTLPDAVVAAIEDVPVVISTRYGLSESGAMGLRCKLRGQIVLPQTRSPFSASAARQQVVLDDNGWIFAVQGPGALAKAMQMEQPPQHFAREAAPQGQGRLPVLFWGILDIKYDRSRPVLDRVKVLETGDGRTSKFSGDGAEILRRYREKYVMEQDMDFQMYQVISADKKLTHDLFDQSGYSHIVPDQVCFPRRYHQQLAADIVKALHVGDKELVILKLCNRSRAAGVIVSPANELDDILHDLLTPPLDLEAWFQDHAERMDRDSDSAADFGFAPGSFAEHQRHWWGNESPVFVAERCCHSHPTVVNGRQFDGTMRVGFAVRRQQGMQKKPWEQQAGAFSPDELEIDWLGGYWKLPKCDTGGSGTLRESVVSAARTSGTAPVPLAHLMEVYAALGDSLQQLFGAAEPSSQELRSQYAAQPALAAFLTARMGTAAMVRSPGRMREMLADSEKILLTLTEAADRDTLQSFHRRAKGVLEVRQNWSGCWERAESHFRESLQLQPTNSNALFFLGMVALQMGKPEDAVKFLRRSLLLDPDFRAGYVNLAIGYLRLGRHAEALKVSEAGSARHPDAPQPHYHVGIACYQLAIARVKTVQTDCCPSECLPESEANLYEELRQRSLAGFAQARSSDEGRRRGRARQTAEGVVVALEAPWLPEDDAMIEAMEESDGPPRVVELPLKVGWTWISYRM